MTLRWEEAIGFLAFGLNVVGNWWLTRKRVGGWGIRIASNAAQMTYALLIWSPSLVLNAATFCVINIVGWRRWRQEAPLLSPSGNWQCLVCGLASSRVALPACGHRHYRRRQ